VAALARRRGDEEQVLLIDPLREARVDGVVNSSHDRSLPPAPILLVRE
jgi:hypothetical protein